MMKMCVAMATRLMSSSNTDASKLCLDNWQQASSELAIKMRVSCMDMNMRAANKKWRKKAKN